MTDCAARALSFFDAWEKRDFDEVMDHIAPAAVVKDHPRGLVLSARADIRGWLESWATACPDSVGGTSVPAASHNSAVVEGVYVGTNTGPFGPLPATGRSVSMPFAIVMHFDAKGKITEYVVYYDQLTLLTQLGHAPAPA